MCNIGSYIGTCSHNINSPGSLTELQQRIIVRSHVGRSQAKGSWLASCSARKGLVREHCLITAAEQACWSEPTGVGHLRYYFPSRSNQAQASRALGYKANRDSPTQARRPLVKGLNLVLLAIIILAWEISSVSRISHSKVLENPHSPVPSLHAGTEQEQMKGACMKGLIPTRWLPSEQERPGHCTGLGGNHGNLRELKTISL